MYVVIRWGNGLLYYKVLRGGKPAVGKVLTVQQAENRGKGGLSAIRRRKPERVRVVDLVIGPALPVLGVEWIKEQVAA